MVVADLMTEKPFTVAADTTIREVMRLFYEHDFRHVPVVSKDGDLTGVVSERDVRTYLVPVLVEVQQPEISADLMDTSVVEIMSGNVLSVNPETDVTDLIDILVEQKVGAVPVVAPGANRLVGIVSYTDVLREAREFF